MLEIATAIAMLLATASTVSDCGSACPPTTKRSPPPPPSDWKFCAPGSAVDAYGAQLLRGDYKVVGLQAGALTSYTGDLVVSGGGPVLLLRKQVGSTTTYGTARYVWCGTESRHQHLLVEYDAHPRKQEMLCSVPAFQQLPNKAICMTGDGWAPDADREAWFEVTTDPAR